jgi:ATP-citrate lyase beta-subunit
MARVKISEYKAKSLVYNVLDLPYHGISFSDPQTLHLDSQEKYVLKVDQGVKKRFLKGLVKVDIFPAEINSITSQWKQEGYDQFLIEPYISHREEEEEYLSLSQTRDGIEILYSTQGGINIEEHQDSMQKGMLSERLLRELPLPEEFIKKLWKCFEENHLAFLEINPLIKTTDGFFPLDCAIEVDSTGEFFVKGAWTSTDFVTSGKKQEEVEKQIAKLSETSQASLSFTLLNPNGSIFLLLSGGGASLVIADEAYQQGMGDQIANYGEYSGNPTAEETYLYTKELLTVLKNSTAQKKVLIIGGGVANFTDIRITFTGVIQALEEFSPELKKQHIKVFVRRGGPNQEEGLKKMETFLETQDLYGGVYGPEKVLTDIVTEAITWLKGETHENN